MNFHLNVYKKDLIVRLKEKKKTYVEIDFLCIRVKLKYEKQHI